jgi:hypothetical protein
MVSRLLLAATTLIFHPACSSTPPKDRDRDPLYTETIPTSAPDAGNIQVAVSAPPRFSGGGGHAGGGGGGGGHGGGGGGKGGAILVGAIVVVAAAAIVVSKIKERRDDRSSKAYPMPPQQHEPAMQAP